MYTEMKLIIIVWKLLVGILDTLAKVKGRDF